MEGVDDIQFRQDAGAEKKKNAVTRRRRKPEGTIDEGETNNVTTTSMCTTISRANLCSGFIEKTISKGVQGLLLEFRAMKRTNDYSKMTAFVAANSTGKNRYKDVGCLDNARVVLTLGPNPYIHANYVDTAGHPKKFICTQGPLDSTIPDFWAMILQERTSAILMLCDYFEQNKSKCAQYIPAKPNETATYGEITVTHLKSVKQRFFAETRTKMVRTKVRVTGYGQQVSCYHFHWQEWPDRGVPPVDVVPIELLGLLGKLPDSPIVIHCSAGVGRTGSIVLLQNFLDVLNCGQPLQEFNTYVEEIRQQRNNSVQTELQYLWVHMITLCYLSKVGLVPETRIPALEAFYRDYQKKVEANQA